MGMANTNKFIPASSSAAAGVFGVTQGETKFSPASMHPHFLTGKMSEYSLNWWSPNSFYHYGSMLTSAFYGIKDSADYRDKYGIPRKSFKLLGDSGGFQNSSQSTNLEATDVLRWQEHNCDVGFIFDWPLSPSCDSKTVRILQDRTLTNAESALNKWSNKDMKLYSVIHGRNREEIDYMVGKYGDMSRYSGIALGSLVPKKSDYMYLAYITMLTFEKIKDYKLPVHFFGLSGVNSLPVILYIANKYGIDITFDSASYGISGSNHREYYNPFTFTKDTITYGSPLKTGATYDESMMLSRLPCNCPVCSVIKYDMVDMIKSKKYTNSIIASLISLHNLYLTTQIVDMIVSYSEKPKLLRGLTKSICVDTVGKALDFVDYSLENGLEKGYEQYYLKGNASANTISIDQPILPSESMFDF
jgi:tRNA-guanine family transglycosylase